MQCLPSSSDSASRDTGVDASNALDAALRTALTVTATQVLKVGPPNLAASRVWMSVSSPLHPSSLANQLSPLVGRDVVGMFVETETLRAHRAPCFPVCSSPRRLWLLCTTMLLAGHCHCPVACPTCLRCTRPGTDSRAANCVPLATPGLGSTSVPLSLRHEVPRRGCRTAAGVFVLGAATHVPHPHHHTQCSAAAPCCAMHNGDCAGRWSNLGGSPHLHRGCAWGRGACVHRGAQLARGWCTCHCQVRVRVPVCVACYIV